MLLWKIFASGLNFLDLSPPPHYFSLGPSLHTSQKPGQALPFFLFSPYIRGISFSIWENLFHFVSSKIFFFFIVKRFPLPGVQVCCKEIHGYFFFSSFFSSLAPLPPGRPTVGMTAGAKSTKEWKMAGAKTLNVNLPLHSMDLQL